MIFPMTRNNRSRKLFTSVLLVSYFIFSLFYNHVSKHALSVASIIILVAALVFGVFTFFSIGRTHLEIVDRTLFYHNGFLQKHVIAFNDIDRLILYKRNKMTIVPKDGVPFALDYIFEKKDEFVEQFRKNKVRIEDTTVKKTRRR